MNAAVGTDGKSVLSCKFAKYSANSGLIYISFKRNLQQCLSLGDLSYVRLGRVGWLFIFKENVRIVCSRGYAVEQ